MLLFAVAMAVFVWGIVKFIKASGDPRAVQEARGIITWGIVGIFILASIAGIVTYLRDAVGITGNTVPVPMIPAIPSPST